MFEHRVIISPMRDLKMVCDVGMWIHENVKGKHRSRYFSNDFLFEFESDAVAFKLRWL